MDASTSKQQQQQQKKARGGGSNQWEKASCGATSSIVTAHWILNLKNECAKGHTTWMSSTQKQALNKAFKGPWFLLIHISEFDATKLHAGNEAHHSGGLLTNLDHLRYSLCFKSILKLQKLCTLHQILKWYRRVRLHQALEVSKKKGLHIVLQEQIQTDLHKTK